MPKNYHVYGLGNALVDIDIEVSLETLHRLNIEKGVMTLIDADRHLQLLEEMEGVKHVKACGGSAANTAVAVAMLGGKAFYSCKVANDDFGDFFCEELHRYNIHSNLENGDREHGTTGSCLVLVTPDADRTMNTYLGITSNFSRKELDEEAKEIINLCKNKKTIILWNKTDISKPTETLTHPHIVSISAKFNKGIDSLKTKLEDIVLQKNFSTKDEVIITKLRHKQALSQAISSSKLAIDGLKQNISPEFIAEDLKNSLFSLATIIGTDVTEDILSSIFKTFCVGK